MKEFIYIYNIKQAEFYIKSGLIPEEININQFRKKVVFKFLRQGTKVIFDKWCKRNQEE